MTMGAKVRVSFASRPGDEAIENEDFVAVEEGTVVVLDGVTPMNRTDTGCQHGVAWFARTVGTRLLTAAEGSERPLTDCLAAAIGDTRDEHAGTCVIDHPDSPAATVAAVRIRDGVLDFLVLADSTVVLDGDELDVVTDHRAGDVSRWLRRRGERPTGPAVRSYRNRPRGYWVAAHQPDAAYEAIAGSAPVDGLRRVVLATDGATRLVDTFKLVEWEEALDDLTKCGLEAFLDRTRDVERADAARGRRHGAKVHDDATIVLLSDL